MNDLIDKVTRAIAQTRDLTNRGVEPEALTIVLKQLEDVATRLEAGDRLDEPYRRQLVFGRIAVRHLDTEEGDYHDYLESVCEVNELLTNQA